MSAGQTEGCFFVILLYDKKKNKFALSIPLPSQIAGAVASATRFVAELARTVPRQVVEVDGDRRRLQRARHTRDVTAKTPRPREKSV